MMHVNGHPARRRETRLESYASWTASTLQAHNLGMAHMRRIAGSRIRRIALLGALVAFLVAMLLGERLNVVEFALLLIGTAGATALGPSIASEARRPGSRDSRDDWAALRASPLRGIPRGILIVLLAGWAVTAGVVLLAYAGSMSVPLPFDGAVSGGVLLIAGLQVSLTVWLWMRRRRQT